ncbi:MAG: arsenate reductase ArsC [Candidatus Firestonebacteria bacterium]
MKTKILFLCVENSCRSQIAEGFGEYYAHEGYDVEVFSAGSKPSGKINENAVTVMREKGIDITGNRSKGFEELPYKEFDIVIGLGCGDACPLFMAKRYLKWNIPDPKGKDLEYFRRARDEIGLKVLRLFKELKEKGEENND